MSSWMSVTAENGLTLIAALARNSIICPSQTRQSFSKLRPRSSIHTLAPMARYDQAISFNSTDLPDPEVPITAAL